MIFNHLRGIIVASASLITLTATAEAPAGYRLVWSDEFNEGTQLDPARWEWETWAPGRVNHELQTYVPGTEMIEGRRTTELRDGKLVITCFQGSDGAYYSGRVNSLNGTPDQGWQYGYIEASIKLPKGKGTWPAFWMMPTVLDGKRDPWPTCGEIDIMEEVGVDADRTSSSLHAIGHYHSNNTQVTAERLTPGAEDDFHLYAIKWDKDNITTYVDGEPLLSYDNDGGGYVNWPYDKPFHIILNLAWGGDWGGYKGIDPEALPTEMQIDYVRVYQLPAE